MSFFVHTARVSCISKIYPENIRIVPKIYKKDTRMLLFKFRYNPAGINLWIINKENNRTMCDIFKVSNKRHHNEITDIVLVSLLLTSNRIHIFFLLFLLLILNNAGWVKQKCTECFQNPQNDTRKGHFSCTSVFIVNSGLIQHINPFV